MAGPGTDAVAPPALVDNVETLANVPGIIARGGSWFRTEGTDQSPGTIVCTVTGRVQHSGVAEFLMGTTLRDVIEEIGGGIEAGRSITAVMGGVSNALIAPDQLDTPLTYEDMAAIGSGLGSASFTVYDDQRRPRGHRGRSVPLPGGRVVRAVHAVQAGRARAGRPPGQAQPFDRRRP